jgi:hypothetical protein
MNKSQTYQNHSTIYSIRNRSQIVYYITVLTMTCLAIANVVRAVQLANGRLNAILLLLTSIALTAGYFMFRTFALKAQDRAIRAEENLRHYVMTGRLHDKDLTIRQIIALRFASDEEFVALSERAVKGKMSSSDIKKAVKNWRADYHRA